MGVSNGRYNFYQIHFIKHNLSNNIYQIPLINYHISITTYQIPLIKYHILNTTYQIPLIKYHFQSKFFLMNESINESMNQSSVSRTAYLLIKIGYSPAGFSSAPFNERRKPQKRNKKDKEQRIRIGYTYLHFQ